MADLCEGGNEPPGSLKASKYWKPAQPREKGEVSNFNIQHSNNAVLLTYYHDHHHIHHRCATNSDKTVRRLLQDLSGNPTGRNQLLIDDATVNDNLFRQNENSEYCIGDRNGRFVTVNAERYAAVIDNFLLLQITDHPESKRDTWFQRDEATSDTARESMRRLSNLFRNHLISRETGESTKNENMMHHNYLTVGFTYTAHDVIRVE
ncbi:hypothetical protein ANN_17488 [Periplaneta americana]|uniref:Uncharacterized protein n=1 Tax=Periplaneta americana TaxID=6978 RepID=A0ABQ8SUH4_PERAM|nr:hypothetical protein ANN_17488 [Periplaneta americana]